MNATQPDPVAAPHPGSHQGVLPRFAAEGVGRVDAIIVPSGRTPDHIRTAHDLAVGLDADLLALCGVRSSAATMIAEISELTGSRGYAVDVDHLHRHPLLPHRPAVPGHGGRASLSLKRNIGLTVARMVGWETVLLLDDDIHGLTPDAVSLAAGGLGPASVVGFAVRDWPDNSVACHANRLGGGDQDVFVGGSALLVDMTSDDTGHFPLIYNEDWLFLFDALRAGRVRRAGSVQQLPYDPFGDPRRGADEEFGEIIAEGLVAHLEDGGADVPLDPAYWAGFVRRRAAFLAAATQRLRSRPPHPRHRAALRALETASGRCAEIKPLHCLRFLRGWRADREAWLRQMDRVRKVEDVAEALRILGLHTAWSRRTAGQPMRAATTPAPLDATVHVAAEVEGVALIVPGFLDGRDSIAHRSLAGVLPTIGLTAVTFDPRSTACNPGDVLEAGTTEELADISSLLDQHLGRGRQVLVGHCYGAWLAGLVAASDPRVTELVAIMPTRCFLWPADYDPNAGDWRRRGVRVFSSPDPGSTVLRTVRVPHAVVEDACRYDLPIALATFTRPVLFIAGSADDVIPADSVRRLFDECGSMDKELVELPGVGHDYRDHPAQLAAVESTVVEWLAARRAPIAPG